MTQQSWADTDVNKIMSWWILGSTDEEITRRIRESYQMDVHPTDIAAQIAQWTQTWAPEQEQQQQQQCQDQVHIIESRDIEGEGENKE
ncbi:MAG: hypothetical protein M1837_003853 [Sclerophora amabilis]|nr:MAG: hypothetical protein M1837_003853 [Sclerophora amabilis]